MEPRKIHKLVRIIKIGAITGGAVTALSFLINLVPCTGQGLCRLPNPFSNLVDTVSEYYGLSNNPITGLALQFLVPAILVIAVLVLIKKKPNKIVDFTKK